MREQYIDEDVITIGQVIRFIKSYLLYFLSKWWLILLVALALGAYRLYVVYSAPPEFRSRLTFTLYEESAGGGGGGAVSSLIGQFGLTGLDNVDFDRIVEFISTRKIMGSALLQKGTINGIEDYYANHYIREFKLFETWEEKEAVNFMDFWFTHSDVSNFTPRENVVLNAIWSKISNGHLKTEIEGSGIIEMSMACSSQPFAVEFIKVLYTELAYFYKEKLNEKNLTNFRQMEYRKDSIGAELKIAEVRYAKFQDANKNLISARALIEDIRLRRGVEVLNAIYLELVRSVEVLNFTLQRETPYLVSIDEPVYPLNYKSPNLIFESIKYAIGGIALILFILAGIKFVTDAIEADKNRDEEIKRRKHQREYEQLPESVV